MPANPQNALPRTMRTATPKVCSEGGEGGQLDYAGEGAELYQSRRGEWEDMRRTSFLLGLFSTPLLIRGPLFSAVATAFSPPSNMTLFG
jgi:hypothetical protein